MSDSTAVEEFKRCDHCLLHIENGCYVYSALGLFCSERCADDANEPGSIVYRTTITPESVDKKAKDKQVGGSYYKDMKIQPYLFIAKNNIHYLEGNVIKYICRHQDKNGKEDLEKAKHYIDLIIEQKYP